MTNESKYSSPFPLESCHKSSLKISVIRANDTSGQALTFTRVGDFS